MPKFDIVTDDENETSVQAAYYTVEDHFLTFKDDQHKQVASFNQDRVVSVARAVAHDVTVGTVAVKIAPVLDEDAFTRAIEAAVRDFERADRLRARSL